MLKWWRFSRGTSLGWEKLFFEGTGGVVLSYLPVHLSHCLFTMHKVCQTFDSKKLPWVRFHCQDFMRNIVCWCWTLLKGWDYQVMPSVENCKVYRQWNAWIDGKRVVWPTKSGSSVKKMRCKIFWRGSERNQQKRETGVSTKQSVWREYSNHHGKFFYTW